MNKIDLILKLVRENKITDEEAKVLMAEDKTPEYVPYYPWGWYPPWTTTVAPYTITYGATSGYVATAADSSNITFTTTTN